MVQAIACQPPYKKTKPQMRKAALACRAVLLSQLSKFKDTIPVFAMGSYALIGLNGVDMPGGVKNARGFVRQEWVIPKVESLHGSKLEASPAGGDSEGEELDVEETDSLK